MERREGDQIKCLRDGEKRGRSDKVLERREGDQRDGEKRGRSDKVFEGWREEREIR